MLNEHRNNESSENESGKTDWRIKTIGIIHSPCKEKFAVPRQSGLVPALVSKIEILKPYDRDEAFNALETFSHIWVLSIFHQALREKWQPTVRPPRLGGNQRVGVFASRSPFRPNPIALSIFKLHAIEREAGKLSLIVSGTDLIEATPVIDIKPYVPYADKPSEVLAGYTETAERHRLAVEFSPQARQQCQQIEAERGLELVTLITQLVEQDPRPAYRSGQQPQAGKQASQYGMRLYDYNISFEVVADRATIISILPFKTVN